VRHVLRAAVGDVLTRLEDMEAEVPQVADPVAEEVDLVAEVDLLAGRVQRGGVVRHLDPQAARPVGRPGGRARHAERAERAVPELGDGRADRVAGDHTPVVRAGPVPVPVAVPRSEERRAGKGRCNTSSTDAYSIVIGSKHLTMNPTG